MGKRMRVPNCTHLDMDSVFGHDQHCSICGRSPSIGFLYECRQDHKITTLRTILSKEHGRIEPVKSALRQELERIGLSESIIRNAESGHYTATQLKKLKELKLELKQVISDTRQATEASDVVARLTALAGATYSIDGTFSSLPVTDSNSRACALRACHSCRPYYRERLYIAFQAVVNGDFSPLTEDDVEELPVKSAQIMRTIGTRVQSSMTLNTTPSTLPTSDSFATSTGIPHTASSNTTDSSEITFKTTQTDIDEISAQRRPRRRFYRMGRRSSIDIARSLSRAPSLLTPQGLKSAVQGIFRPGREPSSEGSNITLPLPRTGTVRDNTSSPTVGEFDLGALRRVRKEKERNELRNGTYAGGFEDVAANTTAIDDGSAGNSNGTDSDFSASSFTTDENENIKIEGVAITEQAVETHTADIVALSVPATQKMGAMVKTAEVKEHADIGLQSIMAQV
ncbi:hypothetical protein J4E82_003709 [Alternaria postmessia]|uniref:uncharacterized protein n=1 Tax=Alternaria postmessia TaxID=1187938 RepID=UPI00222570F1|nr:uncharacterized protein J4E82_003709 [Alternaria postmessia]KAI5377614.1 hypothetical protein J4E82_003709 [Alternaria postmessia]